MKWRPCLPVPLAGEARRSTAWRARSAIGSCGRVSPAAPGGCAAELAPPPLPFFGPLGEFARLGQPVFYLFSPSVLPKPSDWRSDIHVVGFNYLDSPGDWQPPRRPGRLSGGGRTSRVHRFWQHAQPAAGPNDRAVDRGHRTQRTARHPAKRSGRARRRRLPARKHLSGPRRAPQLAVSAGVGDHASWRRRHDGSGVSRRCSADRRAAHARSAVLGPIGPRAGGRPQAVSSQKAFRRASGHGDPSLPPPIRPCGSGRQRSPPRSAPRTAWVRAVQLFDEYVARYRVDSPRTDSLAACVQERSMKVGIFTFGSRGDMQPYLCWRLGCAAPGTTSFCAPQPNSPKLPLNTTSPFGSFRSPPRTCACVPMRGACRPTA